MTSKIKGWFLMVTIAVLNLTNAHAQHKCGVSAVEGKKIMEQMHINRNEMRDYVHERGAITYVPVRFFLVAKSDGTGRASERAGLDALCLLNEHYADQEIQFYIKEFKYINNTTIYSNCDDVFGQGFAALKNQMIYNAINIFLVHEMETEGVLGFYQPEAGPNGNDWVVALEGSAGEKLVVTHEIGHFFSLNHTFYGWESSGGWDAATHGNPVGPTSPDGMPNERVNMSNCSGNNCGGDCLCDTPADYMFPNNACSYTQNAKDPNGQSLSPDFQNFMNYVYGCSDYHFSEDQKEAIKNSLFSSSRNYVRPTNYTPNTAIVTGSPTLVSPQSDELIPTYNAVPLEWTALPGADKYLVEITTSGLTRRFVTTPNTTIVNNLLPNKTYLWKVLGFNEYSTCGNFSTQKKFKTGDLVNDTAFATEIEKWTITPNPVTLGQSLYVNFSTSTPVTADITIFKTNGQLVQERLGVEFPIGDNAHEIETNVLSTGLYFVNVKTKNSSKTQRVSIVE
jgi:Secretion system C-terminal sorting domain